jgi:hypothetical protein
MNTPFGKNSGLTAAAVPPGGRRAHLRQLASLVDEGLGFHA